ncbi:hypothetical protein NDU88_003466 [Pleurodeles waltl]|uniref:Uncharacterized protein n=1 Tax=Pleurodeles waltl TaxID=8319 RepID=A0AAV7MB51_PLEWA|nr:hypothetical protein NDU88_003466 [Pleurodeles waltl]
MMQRAVLTGHGAGSGSVTASSGVGETRAAATVQAGCLVMTQESKVLASVDRGCGAGRCFVYLTSGVHRPRCRKRRRCQQEQSRRGCPGCGVSRQCQSVGPTGRGVSNGSVKSSDDGVGETRDAVRSGAM